ncbi:TonB-dependent siderophore receptor [Marinomonas epiphytica]
MKSSVKVKQPNFAKSKISKHATYATLALALIPFPKTLLAAEIENSTALPTLTVEGNALYDASSSEELTGYNVEAATVGTKTPAALKDIPQSITVITNDYIEDRGAVYLDDVTKTTPGLTTLSNESGRSSIFARGYEYDDLLIDGLSAPVGSQQGTLPSLSAFDRIEIMRGPSGLFSSTSEMGGIMNLVRKRGTEDTQASINIGAGSWGRYQLGTDVSGSLNEDGSVRGRLVLDQSNAANQIEDNENISQSVYATVEIDLDDDTELSVGVLHQTKDIDTSNGLPSYADGTLLDLDTSTFFGADWNEFNAESTDVFADLTHRFDNGGRGRIAARVSDRTSDFDYAYTGSSVNSDDNITKFSEYASDIDQQAVAFDASYSQPFEAMGNVSEFVVGLDYKKEKSTQNSNISSASGTWNIYSFDSSSLTKDLFSVTRTTNSDTSEQEQAVYGKLTFRPIENLALITGARVSNYDLDTGTDTATGSHVTPYAGLVYDLTDSHALYASYSEVFKPQDSVDENGDFIDPREGEQVEFGIKGSYLNGLLNSRLTAFQLTDKNRAEQVDGETYYETTGEYQVRGFEAEIAGQFGQWDTILGYTYMQTKVLSGSTSRYFSLMPEHNFSAWSKYRFEAPEESLLNNMTVGAGLTAVSDFATSDGSVKGAGYATVDASVSKQINDNLKVSFNINNLFDTKYYARVGATSTFNFYGPSRNFMANATYSF